MLEWLKLKIQVSYHCKNLLIILALDRNDRKKKLTRHTGTRRLWVVFTNLKVKIKKCCRLIQCKFCVSKFTIHTQLHRTNTNRLKNLNSYWRNPLHICLTQLNFIDQYGARKKENKRIISDKAYRCRTKILCNQLKPTIDHFTTGARSVKAWYKCCTQINESLNNLFSYIVPKNNIYRGSMWLTNRIMLAIAINVVGYIIFFKILMQKIDIDMTTSIAFFWTHLPCTKQKELKNTSRDENNWIKTRSNTKITVRASNRFRTNNWPDRKRSNACQRCKERGHNSTLKILFVPSGYHSQLQKQKKTRFALQ